MEFEIVFHRITEENWTKIWAEISYSLKKSNLTEHFKANKKKLFSTSSQLALARGFDVSRMMPLSSRSTPISFSSSRHSAHKKCDTLLLSRLSHWSMWVSVFGLSLKSSRQPKIKFCIDLGLAFYKKETNEKCCFLVASHDGLWSSG